MHLNATPGRLAETARQNIGLLFVAVLQGDAPVEHRMPGAAVRIGAEIPGAQELITGGGFSLFRNGGVRRHHREKPYLRRIFHEADTLTPPSASANRKPLRVQGFFAFYFRITANKEQCGQYFFLHRPSPQFSKAFGATSHAQSTMSFSLTVSSTMP